MKYKSKEDKETDWRSEYAGQKRSRGMMSADEFLRKVEELEYCRSQVAKLEREICEGGEQNRDLISPLWSKVELEKDDFG